MEYQKFGFKSGLEIHQQLDTKKLFCNTSSFLRSDDPKYSVRRKLHAIAGETGEIDEAVKHEASLDREFIYQGYDSISLIELDEEPPLAINEEALEIGLHIALLLNCDILPVSQVMRKIVIDGSNTSGFQRTVLIARNGYVETKDGKVKIDTVVLEEDAARIISREKNKTVYRLDRLGIPLVEIATSPDIKTPEQFKEVALHIGDILRACKVKRGIGTIRQDVNLSIKGHPRIEIKGFQDVKMFVATINKEVERQIKNLNSKNLNSEVRKANPDGSTDFLRPMPGSARMYPETDLPLLFISKEQVDKARRNIPKLRSNIREELKKQGLNDEMIGLVLGEGKLEEFKSLIHLTKDANLVAKVIVLWPKDIAKKLNKDIEEIYKKLSLDIFERVIKESVKNNLSSSEIQDVLTKIVSGLKLEEAVKVEKKSLDEIEEFVSKLVKEKPGLSTGGYMGLIMAKFNGKVSGKEAGEILKKYVK
ncbi:Glu-tRNA(Gln) amidotransferase GatDE subunit E [Candidatus Pacearchaeota archaeon CG10_big_fil_rev_8_21_14_0_10_31_9]|nr:MAG: glutamyl-tRNA(Gln) amidotransferase subunit E [Candidatus Pacearchaeota archaeon CG1_02_32_21]PIN96168.1 MAG: Glu-tRNA(Gln) amidotransferase GatDE subunit E [Candidatus Pacearchaeota archaeon CG10_big_fil_rev_8_21_14_0_10_31_9]PIZ83049.1 MAG: Glu-tRNA(Gln) amidotransferase GatDE subunit E [Candidatus Pacearchaeota archaeon CG_4_10_14_0_2_um_filter_05_32_18]